MKRAQIMFNSIQGLFFNKIFIQKCLHIQIRKYPAIFLFPFKDGLNGGPLAVDG